MDPREETAHAALGSVGPWQQGTNECQSARQKKDGENMKIKIFLLMAFLKFPTAWTLLGLIFMGASVPHKCVGSDSECKDVNGEACTSWNYNRTVFKETISTEWDLVCTKSQLVNFAQMTFMIGIMFGTILFSIASDRWGRKKPLILAGILQLITGVATAFIPWYWGFIVLRFLQALSVGGAMTISFVLCMEVLSGSWRTIMASLTHIPFNLGTIIMSGLAWLTRDWRTFQLAISLPIIVIFLYPWLITESPRWLLAVGRDKEALKILQEAAIRNGRVPPEKIPEVKKEADKNNHVERKSGVTDLLRTPNMRKKTLVAWFCWNNVGLCFFGLEQYLSQVGGNIFVNVALSGACIIPGVLASIFTMDKFGRRWTLCVGQFTAATCCLIIICLPKDAEWWRVTFATIGVTGTAVGFTTLYLYSTELFPTVVRNTGLGAGSMCARIGSMVAPFVASLDKLWHNAPAVMFGCSSLAAGLLCLLLPETLGAVLPVTLADGEAFTGPIKDTSKGKENKAYVEDIQMET